VAQNERRPTNERGYGLDRVSQVVDEIFGIRDKRKIRMVKDNVTGQRTFCASGGAVRCGAVLCKTRSSSHVGNVEEQKAKD